MLNIYARFHENRICTFREITTSVTNGYANEPTFSTTCLLHAFASIAAAEKRPLSYQTPQSVYMVRNCGAQTLPLTMHYGGKKIGGK